MVNRTLHHAYLYQTKLFSTCYLSTGNV